jgi:hypothetical protein
MASFDAYHLSDFLVTYILGVWFVAFPNRSGILPDFSRISQFPCKKCPCMLRFSDCAETLIDSLLLTIWLLPYASLNSVGPLEVWISQLQWLACIFPWQRFIYTFTSVNAWLRMVSYSFPVFHLLLLAGFDRRTKRQIFQIIPFVDIKN